ncbi:MAG: YihY/virulence factor BrkB family protein [Pyrinomonadaceae bacterium]
MRKAGSLWRLEGLTWRELAGRVFTQIQQDEVFGRAAQLSYYFLFALFPLLLFLTALLGYFTEVGTKLRARVLDFLGAIAPPSAYELIYKTVDEISRTKSAGKISIGLLVALWASSNGMVAIITSLNAVYNLDERRVWWKRRLVSIGLTIAFAALILTALTLLLFGREIGEHIAGSYGLGKVFTLTWRIVQWLVALGVVLLSFGLIYNLAPNLKERRWRWLTPGAVLGVTLWLSVSFVLRLYLDHFNSYSVSYGSLGAVIILMLWFYLTGASILIGGEVNSEVMKHQRERARRNQE